MPHCGIAREKEQGDGTTVWLNLWIGFLSLLQHVYDVLGFEYLASSLDNLDCQRLTVFGLVPRKVPVVEFRMIAYLFLMLEELHVRFVCTTCARSLATSHCIR